MKTGTLGCLFSFERHGGRRRSRCFNAEIAEVERARRPERASARDETAAVTFLLPETIRRPRSFEARSGLRALSTSAISALKHRDLLLPPCLSNENTPDLAQGPGRGCVKTRR